MYWTSPRYPSNPRHILRPFSIGGFLPEILLVLERLLKEEDGSSFSSTIFIFSSLFISLMQSDVVLSTSNCLAYTPSVKPYCLASNTHSQGADCVSLKHKTCDIDDLLENTLLSTRLVEDILGISEQGSRQSRKIKQPPKRNHGI